ncbi:ATP-binding protein [Actinoplanes sp. LDG1-06]|uniref:ATP-binding protein n=1 Tax=Paractinoplanes ovalisporus TaxID=2810368 RepID=A0ABS2AM10_9ACTN|nr:ATP-binding protein [Actinoplanes ovalisporus]MBM2620821.1 ATP-binding protein [Actinoplanes ovalisporus]
MTDEERAALAALRFSWAQVPDDVWRSSPFHVDGLHATVVQDVLEGIAEAEASADASPIGLVLQGPAGSGKTHLLGWVREQVQRRGGYFFLIGVLDGRKFWDAVLLFLIDGLARPAFDGETQLSLLLRRLSARVGAPRNARRAAMGQTGLTRPALDAFIDGLRDYAPHLALQCRDTARALTLLASGDEEHQDIADTYLACEPEAVPGERRAWGIRSKSRTQQEIVRDISWLLALTGPTVFALDQLDTLVAQAAVQDDLAKVSGELVVLQQTAALTGLAGGLMELRESTRRTLTLAATLSTTWDLIESRAISSFPDRFRRNLALGGIRSPELARQIIEKRFAARYTSVGFTPPYPTWPIQPRVFAEAVNYTPRRLLVDINRHIRACLLDNEVRELGSLAELSPEDWTVQPAEKMAPAASDEALLRVEDRFQELKREADVTSPLEHDTEDKTVPALLSAGLHAWIVERGDAGRMFSVDPPPSAKADLHARLRRGFADGSEEDPRSEDQVHWCFRAISDTHHGTAALHRIRRARTAAGLSADVAKRKLFLIRNGPWSQSAKTQEETAQLREDGGVTLGIDEADLRVLDALHRLRMENPAELHAWLIRYRPTEQITLFKEALADVDSWTVPASPPAEARPPVVPEAVAGFPIGRTHGDDHVPVTIDLEALRKHAAIFAASGSGKTVLIRHLVEECALLGVSAIVLDPNNDLARLGDPWPEPPDRWRAGDDSRAVEYLAATEVVVWTPRRETGRPLSFQPLPDFASVRDDPDEFAAAVEAAASALAPRANVLARTKKAHLGLAVLRKAIEHYGRQGGSSLRGLIELLADLPEGVSELADATRIGADLGQTLTASMDNDPMFGGGGTPADPGILLTPSAGKRARISVISMIGLNDEARQSFVNQLQMSLFAWIKKHPATDRPLLGLLVMDEAQNFAPSGAMTACTQSTLALAAQARKYGLGLLFATQAPKSLHNRVSGNAATHLFGRLTVPAQIAAAQEMARVKGGEVPDIGSLTFGEFYAALEGEAPQKIDTPLCLSHHPSSPLTDEEVMERARRPLPVSG